MYSVLCFMLLIACVTCIQVVNVVDPDANLPTDEIITRHGYPAESHTIQTSDGYILTLHRIPHGLNTVVTYKGVVFLQHGLLGSSADWVIAGPQNALPYLLADTGYDVWMGNARGNTYSRAHVKLTPADREFWQFSWSEMAEFDVPAAIDYILAETNNAKLRYVGHSMGTTMFFAMTSIKPEYNNKIKEMFALAPVAYLQHVKSPLRFIAPYANDIEYLTSLFGKGAFLPRNSVVKFVSDLVCDIEEMGEEVCSSIIFLLCGFSKGQFNKTLLPDIVGHTPAGTSTQTVVHYAQEINSGKFQHFDYGAEGNMAKYNTKTPPQYNVSAITTRINLFYSDNDWLASEADVNHLSEQLKCPTVKYLINYSGFNHVDFIWGKDVRKLVYEPLLEKLETPRKYKLSEHKNDS